MSKKFMVVTMVFAMLFSYFAKIVNVFAESSTTKLTVTFRGDNANYGTVQYSLDDGASWNDIIENTENLNITVTGDNLRLKIVPNANYSIDYAGIEMRHDDNVVGGLSTIGFESSNGYSVPSNVQSVKLEQVEFSYSLNNNDPEMPELNATAKVNISVSGEEFEYDNPWSDDATDFRFGINASDEIRRLGKDEVNYIRENDKIVGLINKNEINYQYNYNNEGTVTFHIQTQWDDVITTLKINNVVYPTPKTKADLVEAFHERAIKFDVANVPYAETYDIEVIGGKQTQNEKIMGNFGWTYDPNTNEYSDDDKIPNGNLEFVKAVYNNITYNSIEEVNAAGEIFEWNDGKKGTNDPTGEAMFPTGTVLTLRLVPDTGYQLTSFDLNGMPFEPGEEVGLYTFTIGGGNWHLGASFNEVNDEVEANSENIKSGNITIAKNGHKFENGTAKLEVNDVISMSFDRVEEFENTAKEEGYELENYLDISLYNTIYKGGSKDVNGKYETWDTPIENIDDKATITLELENDMSGKELAIVHEKHNGNEITGYELIDATYNEEDNTITFETNSFSNYAIVSKDATEKVEYTIKDASGNEIIFKNNDGHNYILTLVDYLSFSKEELVLKYDVDPDEYDLVFNTIKEKTGKYGDLLSFYEIIVTDEHDREVNNGPFTIKIKMTDKMKKYNTFKIMYIDDELNIEKPIDLKVEGDYLVGSIPHLSKYILTGSITENPQTIDNIMNYISILGLSMIGLIGTGLYTKKKLFNK
ncbi:MAG: hypothetical protein IKN63_03250 [Bacilli bacterium]|nr:hypothetical protein [Bacilli bacterium]